MSLLGVEVKHGGIRAPAGRAIDAFAGVQACAGRVAGLLDGVSSHGCVHIRVRLNQLSTPGLSTER